MTHLSDFAAGCGDGSGNSGHGHDIGSGSGNGSGYETIDATTRRRRS